MSCVTCSPNSERTVRSVKWRLLLPLRLLVYRVALRLVLVAEAIIGHLAEMITVIEATGDMIDTGLLQDTST